MGALSKLDEFLLNPQVRICSVAVRKTSRNSSSENRQTTGDPSLGDPSPEVEFSTHYSGNLNYPEQEETHHLATGVEEEIRCRPHMATGVQEEIPYSSPGSSSGKQKKARSKSQPQFRSENTTATIELDQIPLALQQLATNSNSAIFNNNNNNNLEIAQNPHNKNAHFAGKSKLFKLFEYLFQEGLKIHSQLTEKDKINYFHCLIRCDAIQQFKKINNASKGNLGENLTVFRRKNVKLESMVTAKHKFRRLVTDPANQKLIDFLDELQKLAEYAFAVAAQAIFELFMYAKLPPRLKKSINQAQLENDTYEQIASHLGKELDLKGLEAPDELQINTATQQPTQHNPEHSKPTCHHCK